MTNQTLERLTEHSSTKVLAAFCFVALALAAVDAAAAAWYLTGSEVVTGAVVGGTATIGGATVGGVATAGASVGAVLATGGAALVVMGAAAA